MAAQTILFVSKRLQRMAMAFLCLAMAQVVLAIERLAPPDSLYTNGAGNYSGWLHRFCRYAGLQHHGRTQLACTSGANAPLPRVVVPPSSWSSTLALSCIFVGIVGLDWLALIYQPPDEIQPRLD